MKSPTTAPCTERQLFKDLIVGFALSNVIGIVYGFGLNLALFGRAALTGPKLIGELTALAVLWVAFLICFALLKIRLSRGRQKAPTQPGGSDATELP